MNTKPIILVHRYKNFQSRWAEKSLVYFCKYMKFEVLGSILPEHPELTIYKVSYADIPSDWTGRRCYEEEYKSVLFESFSMDYELQEPNEFYESEKARYLVEWELVK